jgi:rhodanese-related sulfurtransferase
LNPVLPQQIPTVDAASVPPDAVLLDVREDYEWAAGHIDGALHVPMMQLPQRLQYDPGPVTPENPVVVVCKVGSRSAQVTAWLRHQGYDATNLAGGMVAWQAAGRPMRAEDGGAPRVL